MTNEDIRESGSSADDRPEGNAPIPETMPVQQEPKEKAQAQSEDRQGWIPPKAHDAEKARRRKAEQEAAQLRGYLTAYQEQLKVTQGQPQQAQTPQPQPPVDWYSDPNSAYKTSISRDIDPRLNELQKKIEEFQGSLKQTPQQVLSETSRMVANAVHGEDAVRTAYEALDTAMKTDPRLDAEIKARLQASSDPYGEIVRWHKQQAEKGTDVDAEIERRVAERLQQYGGAGSASVQPYAPQQPYPSNFANSRNASGKTNGAWGGPKPLTDIFGGR